MPSPETFPQADPTTTMSKETAELMEFLRKAPKPFLVPTQEPEKVYNPYLYRYEDANPVQVTYSTRSLEK